MAVMLKDKVSSLKDLDSGCLKDEWTWGIECEKKVIDAFLVSESLPRLISGADGSDSLPQTLGWLLVHFLLHCSPHEKIHWSEVR
ncbi:hypothetical protein K0M31_002013 [Melipona bicolor]|uniref:Uncharacterized protein n=1 Tax=Melipona bicolor TaxID=60889 RepID=A0AA40KYG2_9HYME|nr:hypothetical protein K0M31_002013 [Melipona bicolor]